MEPEPVAIAIPLQRLSVKPGSDGVITDIQVRGYHVGPDCVVGISNSERTAGVPEGLEYGRRSHIAAKTIE
jgi:hypothetical protein